MATDKKDSKLVRSRTFHLATKEKITGVYYHPGNGLDVQVSLGEDREGLFEPVQGSNPETYNMHGEVYKRVIADPELKSLLDALELKLWESVDAVRAEVLDKREKQGL